MDDSEKLAAFLLAARNARIVTIPGGQGLLIGDKVFKFSGPKGSEAEAAALLALAMKSAVLA
jgi:hypothetical protein